MRKEVEFLSKQFRVLFLAFIFLGFTACEDQVYRDSDPVNNGSTNKDKPGSGGSEGEGAYTLTNSKSGSYQIVNVSGEVEHQLNYKLTKSATKERVFLKIELERTKGGVCERSLIELNGINAGNESLIDQQKVENIGHVEGDPLKGHTKVNEQFIYSEYGGGLSSLSGDESFSGVAPLFWKNQDCKLNSAKKNIIFETNQLEEKMITALNAIKPTRTANDFNTPDDLVCMEINSGTASFAMRGAGVIEYLLFDFTKNEIIGIGMKFSDLVKKGDPRFYVSDREISDAFGFINLTEHDDHILQKQIKLRNKVLDRLDLLPDDYDLHVQKRNEFLLEELERGGYCEY